MVMEINVVVDRLPSLYFPIRTVDRCSLYPKWQDWTLNVPKFRTFFEASMQIPLRAEASVRFRYPHPHAHTGKRDDLVLHCEPDRSYLHAWLDESEFINL